MAPNAGSARFGGMRWVLIFWTGMLGLVAGQVRSGHAEAELLAKSTGYQPGEPVLLGIRLRPDEGWHSYWVNPGESGMPTRVKWKLPEGWTAGELRFPVPIRFTTGGLPGYGYEGEVVIPVELTPGANSTGRVSLSAELSWLTCTDEACVPGDAGLSLTLEEGGSGVGQGAGELARGIEALPVALDGATLEVSRKGEDLALEVRLPAGQDATGCQVFPATPSVVDDSKPIVLSGGDGRWTAEVAINEYAEGDPEELALVLAGGGLKRPLRLEWRRSAQ